MSTVTADLAEIFAVEQNANVTKCQHFSSRNTDLILTPLFSSTKDL